TRWRGQLEPRVRLPLLSGPRRDGQSPHAPTPLRVATGPFPARPLPLPGLANEPSVAEPTERPSRELRRACLQSRLLVARLAPLGTQLPSPWEWHRSDRHAH